MEVALNVAKEDTSCVIVAVYHLLLKVLTLQKFTVRLEMGDDDDYSSFTLRKNGRSGCSNTTFSDNDLLAVL